MEQNNKWSSAAMDGLFLSLVTVIYLLAANLLDSSGFVVKSVLWIAKFGGSLYLLWYFMKRYSNNFETITYGQSFNYGFIVCLFSSIIVACFSYVQVEWLFPDKTAEAMQMSKEMIAQQGLDSASESVIEVIFNNFGRITLFSNLVYCTIFGAIAAAITANWTKKTNPFEDEELSE